MAKLTGSALIAHHSQDVTKRDRVISAGYIRENGLPCYTEYYSELLYAQGKVSKVRVTITDTFGGEANYSWVDLHTIYIPEQRDPIRYIKKQIGWTGVKCDKTDMGDCVMLYPRGQCKVIIIQWV
jgi:hypothetical protein